MYKNNILTLLLKADCSLKKYDVCFTSGFPACWSAWSPRTALRLQCQLTALLLEDLHFKVFPVFSYRRPGALKTESMYPPKLEPTGRESSPTPKQLPPKLEFVEFWPNCLDPDASFEEGNFQRFE